MMRINDNGIVPPDGGWTWVDSETGTKIQGSTPAHLKEYVLKFLKANGRGFDETEFIQNTCAHTTGNRCVEARPGPAPEVAEKLASFFKNVGKWAQSGFKMADKETLGRRLLICQGDGTKPGCEHWSGVIGGSLVSGQCHQCGCTGIKLALSTSQCPIGKW